MNTILLRPYRKNLTTQGLIYLAGKEQEITIVNISMTGLLARLNDTTGEKGIREIFNTLLSSSVLDLYLPELHTGGEAQVTRVDLQDDHILIALEFKNLTNDADHVFYKRKVYRKNLPEIGQILINDTYLEFKAVNVSVEGMMIQLNPGVTVAPKSITMFKFEKLGLEGEVEVVWVDGLGDGVVLMGLRYVHIEKKSIKGIPEFARTLAA